MKTSSLKSFRERYVSLVNSDSSFYVSVWHYVDGSLDVALVLDASREVLFITRRIKSSTFANLSRLFLSDTRIVHRNECLIF